MSSVPTTGAAPARVHASATQSFRPNVSSTSTCDRKRPLRAVMQRKESGRAQAEPGKPNPGYRDPRILCIDDDPEICRTLEMRLGEYQAEVQLAYFGTQGFWEAITDHPDLILMDVAMPSGDGRFVLESLRKNAMTERIPVIVLTGMRDPRLRSQLFALGADQYLTKPIHFQELLPEITRFVDLRKREAATGPPDLEHDVQ